MTVVGVLERVAYTTQREVDGNSLRSLVGSLPYVEGVASAERPILWFGSNQPILTIVVTSFSILVIPGSTVIFFLSLV